MANEERGKEETSQLQPTRQPSSVIVNPLAQLVNELPPLTAAEPEKTPTAQQAQVAPQAQQTQATQQEQQAQVAPIAEQTQATPQAQAAQQVQVEPQAQQTQVAPQAQAAKPKEEDYSRMSNNEKWDDDLALPELPARTPEAGEVQEAALEPAPRRRSKSSLPYLIGGAVLVGIIALAILHGKQKINLMDMFESTKSISGPFNKA